MLVLASNSPRRKQLLRFAGYTFKVVPAEIDEEFHFPETPQAYVCRLAEAKARRIATGSQFAGQPGGSQATVAGDAAIVAADTTVELDGKVLGKPVDVNEAEAMLRMLRSRTHKVHTALAVLRLADQATLIDVCTTDVRMRNYTDEEINRYVASGDPLDKAGAYAIQHAGFHPVESLQGCFTNVIGLPLCRLNRMFSELGIAVPQTPFACLHAPQEDCSIPPAYLSVDT